MTIRVLSGEDVEQALTMRDCIEAMDTVLREHAAGELSCRCARSCARRSRRRASSA